MVVVATIVWGRVLVQIESIEVVLRGGNVHMVTDDGRLVIEELQLLEDGRQERKERSLARTRAGLIPQMRLNLSLETVQMNTRPEWRGGRIMVNMFSRGNKFCKTY